jgi:CheY-like chemotaxis protein
VRTATDAEAGLELLAGADVDCVVSDYEMPDATGVELLHRVRSGYPDLPFILYTGKGSEEVASDGPGIPPDRRGRVFEFGHSAKDGGTGLGLSIVRKVADAHGWDVRVTDGSDGGARFEASGVGAE